MCDCISYNRPDLCLKDGLSEAILKAPEWSNKDNGICIDACIADTIEMLWNNGVVTLGSCCGHNGKLSDSPIIIVESGQEKLAYSLLKENDDREWNVLSWNIFSCKLVSYNEKV